MTPKIIDGSSVMVFTETVSPFLEKMVKLRKKQLEIAYDMEMKVKDDLIAKLFKTKKYRSLDDISELGSN